MTDERIIRVTPGLILMGDAARRWYKAGEQMFQKPSELVAPKGLRLSIVTSHTILGVETVLRAIWLPWQGPMCSEFDVQTDDITDPENSGWSSVKTRIKFGLHDCCPAEPGHTYRVSVRMVGSGRVGMSEWSEPATITVPAGSQEPDSGYLDRIAAATRAVSGG